MDREALGTCKGCLNIWGCWGIRVVSKYLGHPNIWGCPDAPKHMGVSTQWLKCKSYMPLKKIRGV